MKRIFSIILSGLLGAIVLAAPDRTPQAIYIEKYADLAVEEMYRSGVPASITLAQGLLESGNGQSELAVKGNNHFGIKCHNTWNGKKMYYDDDRRGECFRVYKTPEESFRDHSDFLRYRDRYKFLFDLDPTDYKGWANGLKKAGYATDPAYPRKLIRLIEEYDLDKYDRMSRRDVKSKRKDEKSKSEKRSRGERRQDEKHVDERPASPHSIEQPKPLDDRKREVFHLSLSRQMYSLNGVPFVNSIAGETYKSIAAANGLFLREILKYNDLEEDQTLYPGTVVYLQPKKNRAAKGLEKHVVEGDGESFRDIAQRYGVKLKKLYKLNGITSDRTLVEGEVIILR